MMQWCEYKHHVMNFGLIKKLHITNSYLRFKGRIRGAYNVPFEAFVAATLRMV